MSNNRDWLPGSRTDQLAMARNWVQILGVNKTAWNIPDDTVMQIGTLWSDASGALTKAQNPELRTAPVNALVHTTFSALVAYMRDIKRRHFFIPPLTESDWVSLGLSLPDTTPTVIHPPTAAVTAELSYPHKNALDLRILPMPGHAYDTRAEWGFRVYYGVLPQVPVSEEMTMERQYLRREPQNPEELGHSHFTRRKRDTIEFRYDNSGMKCFISIRYENGKGEAGPWGPIISGFIP